MKSASKGVAMLVLIGFLAILTLGTAWILDVGPFTSTDRGPVIATVDGRPIRLSDARSRVTTLAGVHTGQEGPLASEDWQDQVLESLVDDQLIQAEAERRAILVTAQELADSVQEVVGMFPSLTDYETWLRSQGMDQDEVERRLELQLLSARVYEAVTADVEVSEEQVRAYYAANPGEFATGDGDATPFGDVRSEIESRLLGQAKDAAFNSWLDEQRSAADVEIVMTDWWGAIDEQQS